MTKRQKPPNQIAFDLRPSADEIEKLLDKARSAFEYGVTDFTIEVLTAKFVEEAREEGEIFIPPYQRKLVWPPSMKSYFIESLLLRVPVPPLFFYEEKGRLEIVDGSQRLRTMKEFIDNKFSLSDLETLDYLNGYSFSELPTTVQRRFKIVPVRTFVLYEKSESTTRFDIFKRLNTSGKKLQDAQIRKGAFPGNLLDLVVECAHDKQFIEICPVGKSGGDPDSERQELVLRFFAYSDRYKDFRHDVAAFLNTYLQEHKDDSAAVIKRRREAFKNVVHFVRQNFPYGFRKTPTGKTTPRVRFEAIAVGVHLALEHGGIPTPLDLTWLDSKDFKDLTRTDASNSGPKLRGRIKFVRDKLIGKK